MYYTCIFYNFGAFNLIRDNQQWIKIYKMSFKLEYNKIRSRQCSGQDFVFIFFKHENKFIFVLNVWNWNIENLNYPIDQWSVVFGNVYILNIFTFCVDFCFVYLRRRKKTRRNDFIKIAAKSAKNENQYEIC